MRRRGRRRKNENPNNKECNKNEIMRVWKLCSSVWVCQKDLISTYGCDMTMESYTIAIRESVTCSYKNVPVVPVHFYIPRVVC
jgi:hypothetical protein